MLNRPVPVIATLALAVASLVVVPGVAVSAGPCAVDAPPVALAELVRPDGELRAGTDAGEARAVAGVEQHLESMPGELELTDVAADPAAVVDECGRLAFVDHIDNAHEQERHVDHAGALDQVARSVSLGEPASATPETAALGADGSDVFALHSRPGATFTIFLDFDGAEIPANNGWAQSYNDKTAMTAPAWSLDSDRTTFNAEEQARIRSLWRATAEAYAPFEIDVTTEQPDAAALERTNTSDDRYGLTALISPLPQVASQCDGCSGIAYVGVSQRTGDVRASVQPALAFSAHAQTIIHELGHNFGLSHHGDSGSPYHRGDAGWTPVMGSGSGHFLQWSRGDFPGATSTTQNDVALIARTTPLRADDHAATTAGATVYGPLDGRALDGVIERPGDADRFSFSATGATGINVELSDVPGLRAEVSLLDAQGTFVRRLDTLDSSRSGRWQQASIREVLPAGDYQLQVRGIGLAKSEDRGARSFLDRGTYGSLGAYSVRLDDGGAVTPFSVADRRATVRFPEGTQNRFVVGTPSGGIGPYTVTCDAPATLVVCDTQDGGRLLPQAQGTWMIPWTMKDGQGATTSGTVSVVVRERTSVRVAGLEPVVEVGSAVRWSLATTGPSLGYSFSWGALPPGVAWSESQRAWTGTATTVGTFGARITVTFAAPWPEERSALTFDVPIELRVVPVGTPTTTTPTPTPTMTTTPTVAPSPSPTAKPTATPTVPTAGPRPSATPVPKATPRKPSFVTKKTLRRAKVGKKYSTKISVSSSAKVTWKRTGTKKLPKGLTWKVAKLGKRTTIVISGRAKKAGTFRFTLRASNTAGARSKTYVVTVARR